MHRVSISYRRNDTAREAHVLKTVLEDRLRNTSVFVDTEDIPPGSRWPERLEKELNRSTAVIVLIGPDWREAPDVPDALERDQDRVRREVELALERGGESVLQVIVERATAQLTRFPDSISDLAQLQTASLDSDRWVDDVRTIVDWAGSVLGAEDGFSGESYPNPSELKTVFPALDERQIAQFLDSGDLRRDAARFLAPQGSHRLRQLIA